MHWFGYLLSATQLDYLESVAVLSILFPIEQACICACGYQLPQLTITAAAAAAVYICSLAGSARRAELERQQAAAKAAEYEKAALEELEQLRARRAAAKKVGGRGMSSGRFVLAKGKRPRRHTAVCNMSAGPGWS